MQLKDKVATQRHRYNAIEDDKLLTLIGQKQDRYALTELYQRYRQPVCRYLHSGIRETKLIEEVYNDVMLTIWHKASNFRGDSKVSTWIFAIAYRQRMAHSRKESKHQHIGNDDMLQEIIADTNKSLIETVQAAIAELSEQHRAVVELLYFHGYSTLEISGIIDCPQNTVKTRLFHARKKLKIILEADYSMQGNH